ncbi:MAG: ABC transporter, partial [Mesorhizobium sp.]
DQSGPIKIVVTGITDADFIANVYGAFLEKQGFKVERVKADYAAQFVGLEAGDLDFSTSIWETSRDIFDAALATGEVVNMGATGVKVREGWWYPTYVEKLCPGLPDWKALLQPDCVKALSTVETAPLG